MMEGYFQVTTARVRAMGVFNHVKFQHSSRCGSIRETEGNLWLDLDAEMPTYFPFRSTSASTLQSMTQFQLSDTYQQFSSV